MKKTISITISIVIALLGIGFYLMFYVFSGVLTPFAKACAEVEIGMKKGQALDIMSNFENKENVTFKEEDSVLVYTTPGFSGDFQCYINLDENGNVKLVTKIFD
jgi:hypothetical protein